MKVQKSINYDMFKHIRGNRQINPKHVSSLIQSIQKDNLLEHNPIMVDPDLTIIDGQHRLEAAKALGEPIYYTFINNKADIDLIQLLNINNRKWTMLDFINSYIERGFGHYKILKDFKKMNGISYAKSAIYLTGSMGKSHAKAIKSGTFKVVSVDKAQECVDFEKEILPYTEEGKYGASRALSYAITRLVYDGFDMEKMASKFSTYPETMPRFGSPDQYLREMEVRFNYRSREKTRIF